MALERLHCVEFGEGWWRLLLEVPRGRCFLWSAGDGVVNPPGDVAFFLRGVLRIDNGFLMGVALAAAFLEAGVESLILLLLAGLDRWNLPWLSLEGLRFCCFLACVVVPLSWVEAGGLVEFNMAEMTFFLAWRIEDLLDGEDEGSALLLVARLLIVDLDILEEGEICFSEERGGDLRP